jgi:hypothetical protein
MNGAEREREKIIRLTTGNTLIGPGSIPWEIGNAFLAMFKQNRLTIAEAEKGISIFKAIPIRFPAPFPPFPFAVVSCSYMPRIDAASL